MASILHFFVFSNFIYFSHAGLNYSTIQFLLYESDTKVHKITDTRKPSKFFRGDSEIIIIVPGWTESTQLKWVGEFVQGYLSRTDKKYQVIAVEWGYEANGWYYHVSGIVDVVGAFIANWMIQRAKIDRFKMSRYHVVSNSIGCQVAGFIGKTVIKEAGRPLHRITALDAAGPGFFYKSPKEKLNKGDAEIIVALHTDCGWKGIIEPYADVDLYPNGGIHPQPGCLDSDSIFDYITEPCSHRRGRMLWAESLNTYKFYGTKCDSWEKYEKGRCRRNKKLNFAGDMWSITKADSGVYYTKTNSRAPLIID